VPPLPSPAALAADGLTAARLAITPVIAWLVLAGAPQPALWLFVAAGLTDLVDGYLARRARTASAIGPWLDPLADKALIGVTYVTLGFAGILPLWLIVLTLLRDGLIVAAVALAWAMRRPFAPAPLMISKVNTALQVALAALALAMAGLPLDLLAGPVTALVWLTAATTVASFVAYGGVFVRWAARRDG